MWCVCVQMQLCLVSQRSDVCVCVVCVCVRMQCGLVSQRSDVCVCVVWCLRGVISVCCVVCVQIAGCVCGLSEE